MKAQSVNRGIHYSFFNLGARRGWVIVVRRGRFNTGNDLMSIVQEVE